MILGMHHAAIAVPNMQAGLDFYCDVLGFEVCDQASLPPGIAVLAEAFGLDDAGCEVRMIRKGGSFLELFEFAAALDPETDRPVNRLGITHIALATDDPEADRTALEDAGVVFNAPLFGTSPARFVYGRDPFGNVIELLEHNPAGPAARDFL